MSPTELERLATLEVKTKNMEQLLLEIKTDLRRLPRIISKKTEAQLRLCRATQDRKRAKDPPGVTPQKSEDSLAWLKKLLIISMTIGTLIGGAVYQYQQSDKPSIPGTVNQGGNK